MFGPEAELVKMSKSAVKSRQYDTKTKGFSFDHKVTILQRLYCAGIGNMECFFNSWVNSFFIGSCCEMETDI